MGIKRYREVRPSVEAVQFDGSNADEICRWASGRVGGNNGGLYIGNSSALGEVRVGDWVVKLPGGFFYRYADERFRVHYEEEP